jgi:hypothetical protein
MKALVGGLLATLLVSPLAAQDTLRIRASRHDTITARAAVTAAFAISSRRNTAVEVLPHIEAPKDWSVLMGAAPLMVDGNTTELLMLSIAVPARAAAGLYPVRVWVTTSADTKGAMDSVVVRVPERHSLEVGVIDKPGFVVSGKAYQAAFLIRNRGNSPTGVRLRVRSTYGSVTIDSATMTLAADEARVISPRVVTRVGIDAASDDVLELTVNSPDDSTFEHTASARVTIVPEPTRKIEEFLKVPTKIRVRAASATGVSPFEIDGHGKVIDGGTTNIDFLFRGTPGSSAIFGERDEYRVQLNSRNWNARLGDQLFQLSQLSGGGQPGFGAGFDGKKSVFAAGVYGQQFRRSPLKGSETGAFVSAQPVADSRIAVNMVDRVDGFLPGRIGSGTASIARGGVSADVEVASSQSKSGATGLARTARFSGSFPAFSYDLGHLHADTGFVGTQHGSDHNYVTASSTFGPVAMGMNASRHRADLSQSTGTPYVEQLDLGAVSATLFDRYSLEISAVNRSTEIAGVTQMLQQRGARAHVEQGLRAAFLTLDGEAGSIGRGTTGQTYWDAALGARLSLSRGSVGAWADQYSGGSITKGANATTTVGTNATLQLLPGTMLMLNAYATRVNLPGTGFHNLVDVIAAQTLRNGNSVSLRARVISGGGAATVDQSVAYLEYGMPLRLPVSRLRTTGRVYGKVVDAVTGRGVSGALVRLGPQAAITDKDGAVAFGGVPGGEHRLSMSQEASFANAVFVGDPTLLVDSTRTSPTTFHLAIARSARVDIDVRRFAAARTGSAGAADSLIDAGPLANAMLILVGDRDTLYRTSSERGKVSFTDIPPGKWVVTIRGDAPAFHRFDPDRQELELAPGEAKAMTFRLVPRKREVQLIGDGQELRPTSAEAKPQAPSAIKTVKPNEQQRQNQR